MRFKKSLHVRSKIHPAIQFSFWWLQQASKGTSFAGLPLQTLQRACSCRMGGVLWPDRHGRRQGSRSLSPSSFHFTDTDASACTTVLHAPSCMHRPVHAPHAAPGTSCDGIGTCTAWCRVAPGQRPQQQYQTAEHSLVLAAWQEYSILSVQFCTMMLNKIRLHSTSTTPEGRRTPSSTLLCPFQFFQPSLSSAFSFIGDLHQGCASCSVGRP